MDDRSISYCVAQLQKYTLLIAGRNVLSEAFESIIGYSLKGTQGQFFTPRHIVSLIVKVIDPSKKDKIIDPAVGSGVFFD